MNEVAQAMKESSRAGTVLGIATIIFGILAMLMPMVAGLTTATIVGALLIAGGIQLCPGALLDDGLLDVAILPEVPKEEQNEKLKALVLEGLPALEREAVRARLPWVELDVPSSLHVNLDGEPIHGTKFRFEVREKWLRFHLPDGAPVGTVPKGVEGERTGDEV